MNRGALALFAAAATGVQVGAAITATRLVANDISPASLAFLRYAIGVACLVPAIAIAGRVRFARGDILPIAALGIGQFGIYSKYQLEAQTVELQAKYNAIKARRVDLERRVQLMHEGTLEKDMLDEQARRALNLSQADEITIMLPANSK